MSIATRLRRRIQIQSRNRRRFHRRLPRVSNGSFVKNCNFSIYPFAFPGVGRLRNHKATKNAVANRTTIGPIPTSKFSPNQGQVCRQSGVNRVSFENNFRLKIQPMWSPIGIQREPVLQRAKPKINPTMNNVVQPFATSIGSRNCQRDSPSMRKPASQLTSFAGITPSGALMKCTIAKIADTEINPVHTLPRRRNIPRSTPRNSTSSSTPAPMADPRMGSIVFT